MHAHRKRKSVGSPANSYASGETCRSCSGPLEARRQPGLVSVLLFCGAAACPLYGVPYWRHVPNSITVDDRGEVVEG